MLSLILFSFDVNKFLFLLFLGMVKTLMKLKQKKNKTYLRKKLINYNTYKTSSASKTFVVI